MEQFIELCGTTVRTRSLSKWNKTFDSDEKSKYCFADPSSFGYTNREVL